MFNFAVFKQINPCEGLDRAYLVVLHRVVLQGIYTH